MNSFRLMFEQSAVIWAFYANQFTFLVTPSFSFKNVHQKESNNTSSNKNNSYAKL